MGVGSLLGTWWAFALIIFLFYQIVTNLPSKIKVQEVRPSELPPKVLRQEIFKEYSDDPDHILAPYRAWDRHLLLMGMNTLFTPDILGDVMNVSVNPEGSRKYIVYGFDHRGHLTGWYETLSPSRLSKTTGSTVKRVSK